jgi:hypothetical protein
MGEKLDRLIEAAKAGRRPTNEQVREAAPLGRSVAESNRNRRQLLSLAVKVAEAAQDGQAAEVDDLVDTIAFTFDKKAKRAAADELAGKLDGAGFRQRQPQGRARLDAEAKISDLLDRAAEGREVTDEQITNLPIRESVTDAELAAFRGQLRTAIGDVAKRRGAANQRDGRHQRARDAEFAAAKYASELVAADVVDGAGSSDSDNLSRDPRELAGLILDGR